MRRIILALVAIMLSFTTLAATAQATTSQPVRVVTVAAVKPPNKCDTVTPASAHKACWEKEIQRQEAEKLFWTEWRKLQEFKRQDAIWRANMARLAESLRRAAVPSGRCGGDLPPCRVMMRESRGDPKIWNGGCYAPVGWRGISPCGSSSASGKWQFVRGTWGGYRGYVNAADAPEWVQDERARGMWKNGHGCYHWNEC